MKIPAYLLQIMIIVLQLYAPGSRAADNAADGIRLAGTADTLAQLKSLSLAESTTDKQTRKAQPFTFRWSMVEQIPELIADGKLSPSQIPDPHWKQDACLACHKTAASAASAGNLRKKNIGDLCFNCHDAHFDHSYIHPVNVKPDAAMLRHIKPGLRKTLLNSAGKVNCASCHDLVIQCLPERRKEAALNPGFFRFGPFQTRTELCFFCHDDACYRRLNPHDQVDDAGNLRENTCRVCHRESLKALQNARSIDELEFHAEGNLSSMCWGCHRWTPHPGGQFTFFSDKPGPDHLVRPSDIILRTMKKAASDHGMDLPLEPGTGKVFCGTCHNAHEKGVIRDKALQQGADANKRLRAQKICSYCHDK